MYGLPYSKCKGDEEMPIHVTSEIGRLKKVLLHRPGGELEQLVPEYLDQLLFDDIPYLKTAQKEHDYFADVLRGQGAKVVYLEDLVAETIAQSSEIKEQFVHEFIEESGNVARHYRKELTGILLNAPSPKALVRKTMAGTGAAELTNGTRGPLVKAMTHKVQFILDPIPNLYFTRDPFATIGEGASMNRMFSKTRNRETIYGRYILSYHPDFRGKVPFYYRTSAPFSIEGGDILNLTERVLAVGISQRTSPEAIELLAKGLFGSERCAVDTILAMDIPDLRAYMHLDTVFTQLDRDKFTVHPGVLDTLQIYILKKQGVQGAFTVEISQRDLRETLEESLQIDMVTLIRCGGKDQVASAREQWNDGANTLCLAPGVVAVYDRNTITNRILEEHGITVLPIPSSELSRGRGGPRCMSMPLQRDDVPV